MEDPTNIKGFHIGELYRRFKNKAYSSAVQDPEDEWIIDRCIALFRLDYKCEIIYNYEGRLCGTYPSRIPIPLSELLPAKIPEEVERYESSLSQAILEACADQPKSSKSIKKINRNASCKKELSDKRPEEKDDPKRLKPSEDGAKSLDQLENNLESSSSSSSSSSDDSDSDIEMELFDVPFLRALTSSVNKSPTKKPEKVPDEDGNNGENDSADTKYSFREYVVFANGARCWYRLPIPTIFCKGKYISRSATLSSLYDLKGKQLIHGHEIPENMDESSLRSLLSISSNLVTKYRFYDIKLLEALGISAIMDLMVEFRKTKFGVTTSSSEKADSKNRYENFNIFSIPYPGCEYFKEFTKKNFCSENLQRYDWSLDFNDAPLSIPETDISSTISTEWDNYKEWDLRTMTENYLRLIHKYILDPDSKETGVLVHCISGWDRTPLFISLLRMSLWADGHIHCSLNAKQMLFLTLAYDWYLFGHQLPDRLKSNENILYFCFEFLEEISNEKFVETGRRKRHHSTGSSASEAYDSATDGNETPASSFGSIASLASSSSSNPPSTIPSAPNIKVSPIKQPSSGGGSYWPFNKENGFTFDGISDNESSVNLAPGNEGNLGSGTVSFSKRTSSPVRSPLRERNKRSPKTTPSPSSKKAGGGRKGNLNGVIRELTGLRSRKSSVTESPNSKGSGGSDKCDFSEDDAGCESRSSYIHPMKPSNPVPVPGVRSRHSSSSDSIGGSWQLVSQSTESGLNDSSNFNSFGERDQFRVPLAAEMADSTTTIKEEEDSLSSSSTSQSSIRLIDRRKDLIRIKNQFVRLYHHKAKEPQDSFVPKIFTTVKKNIWN